MTAKSYQIPSLRTLIPAGPELRRRHFLTGFSSASNSSLSSKYNSFRSRRQIPLLRKFGWRSILASLLLKQAQVWTTCVGKNTLDEAPQAYKKAEEIISKLPETVEIVDHLKPVYNFKASE